MPRQPIRRSAIALFVLACAPFSTASAIDLVDVYSKARDYDATIQGAIHDLESARQSLPLARSAFRPQLGLDASVALAERFNDGDDRSTTSSLSLQLSQSLFNRPNSALVDQAGIGVQQAELRFASTAQDLVLRVADAYFDVLSADANVQFSQSELQAIARQRDQAERRFDVGLIPITDVRTSQAQYDLAVAQEIAASNQYETATEALRVLSGLDIEQVAPLAPDLPLAAPEPADIDAWVEMAREQNLSLLIARLSTDAADAQIDVERGKRLPTLDAVLSGRTQDSDIDFNTQDGESAQIGLQANWSLYTGGRIKAQVAQARADFLSASEGLAGQERTAAQQARDSYRGVLASISRTRALRQALDSTQQSADAVEAGFRAGTRTSVEVLNALRDVFRARSDYSTARYEYLLSSLRLKSAAGTLGEDDLVDVNRFLQEPE